MDPAHLALVAAAAVAAGFVNAIAGGGSLVTFPALVACGVPALVANVTNTVALCPGYLGATAAQRRELVGQGRRAWLVLPAGMLGGFAGALLLLATGDAAFEYVVPFLLVFAALLLAIQDPVRRWIASRSRHHSEAWAIVPVALTAVYGGYFGAGMSIIMIAALAIVLDDSLVRINALKQAIALVVNLTAAIVFALVGHVQWVVAGVMAVAALGGGMLGGAVASRVPPRLLRVLVVGLALAVAAVYFARF